MVKKQKNRLLDLDAMNKSIGDVKVGGNRYKMYQPAYEDFIMLPILFDKLGSMENITDDNFKEQKLEEMGQMRGIVQRIIPELDQNILTFAQLMKIVDYVSEKFEEQIGEEYNVTVDGSDKGK